MKSILIATILAALAATAHATGTPTPPVATSPAAEANATAQAAAAAHASAVGMGGAGGAGGAGGNATTGPISASTGSSSVTDASRLYVLPPPAAAAPLPATTCPKGDSESWSIGWGFVSFAKSTTRTELECLERVVALMRASAPPASPPVLLIDTPKPTAPLVQPTAATTPAPAALCAAPSKPKPRKPAVKACKA